MASSGSTTARAAATRLARWGTSWPRSTWAGAMGKPVVPSPSPPATFTHAPSSKAAPSNAGDSMDGSPRARRRVEPRGPAWRDGQHAPPVELGAGERPSTSRRGFVTCARLDGGIVKCWGANLYGVLGLGDTKSRGGGPGRMGDALLPVDLGAGEPRSRSPAGGCHTCARLGGGAVKCWGASGQLGLGEAESRGDGPGQIGDALPDRPRPRPEKPPRRSRLEVRVRARDEKTAPLSARGRSLRPARASATPQAAALCPRNRGRPARARSGAGVLAKRIVTGYAIRARCCGGAVHLEDAGEAMTTASSARRHLRRGAAPDAMATRFFAVKLCIIGTRRLESRLRSTGGRASTTMDRMKGDSRNPRRLVRHPAPDNQPTTACSPRLLKSASGRMPRLAFARVWSVGRPLSFGFASARGLSLLRGDAVARAGARSVQSSYCSTGSGRRHAFSC